MGTHDSSKLVGAFLDKYFEASQQIDKAAKVTEDSIKQSEKRVTNAIENMETSVEKAIKKANFDNIKIGSVHVDSKEFKQSAKQLVNTVNSVVDEIQEAVDRARSVDKILDSIDLDKKVQGNVKKVIPNATKEQQNYLTKLLTAMVKIGNEYDSTVSKITDNTSGKAAMVTAKEYANVMTEMLNITQQLKLESEDLINTNAIEAKINVVTTAMQRSGKIITKSLKPVEEMVDRLINIKGNLKLSENGEIIGERPNKSDYTKKSIYQKAITNTDRYDVDKYLNWDKEKHTKNSDKELHTLMNRLEKGAYGKAQSKLSSEVNARYVGLMSKALAEANLDIKNPKLDDVIEKINNRATQEALDYYMALINKGVKDSNKVLRYNPELEQLAMSMSEKILSTTSTTVPDTISNPVVVDGDEYDNLKKKADQANDSVGNLKKTLKELADQQRQEGNVNDYDGNDWKYSKDSIERYAAGIKSLQDQIGQTTDAKLLDDLNRDLEDAKISFIALYDTVNDVFDGKLNKNRSIKADIRNLYSSLIGEVAQFDTHFGERVSVPTPSSNNGIQVSLEQINKELDEIGVKIKKLRDEGNNIANDGVIGTKSSDMYKNQISQLDTLIERIKELKNQNASYQLPDTATALINKQTGNTNYLDAMIAGLEQQRNELQTTLDSIDVELERKEAKIKEDVASFMQSINSLEGNKEAEPQWVADYITQIQKSEIELEQALEGYKDKLSKKLQEIADEKERNRINNEQAHLFVKEFGDTSEFDSDKLAKYTDILNQISSGAMSAADGIEKFKNSLKTLEGASTPTVSPVEETKQVEDLTEANDRNNHSLAEKLEYLKEIQKASKFMEDAEDRRISMEEKAYDVGGNNPKSEADSLKKIQMYEDLCEKIKQSSSAIDKFNDSYEKVLITMKNGSIVEINDLWDLDGLKLLKSQIQDIKFVLFEELSDIDILLDDELLLEELINDMENVEKQAEKTESKLSRLFNGKRPSISENPPRLKERYHDESYIEDIESGNVRLVKSYEEVEDVIRRIDSSKYKRNMYDLRTATLGYEPDGMKNLQQALGLFDELGNRLVELNVTGISASGVFVTNDYAIKMLRRQTDGLDELIQKLKEAKNAGVQLAEIYGEFSTRTGIYQIQEVGKGVNLFPTGGTKQRPLIEEQNDALKVKDEHIQKLILDMQKLDSLGVKIDGISGNFMYDAEKGFTAIDLSLKKTEDRALTLRDILLYVSNVMTGGYGNRGGIFDNKNIEKTTELMAKVKQNFLSLGYSSKDINNTFVELFGEVINGYKMINNIDNLIDPEKIVPNEVFKKLDHLRTEIRDTEKLVKENKNKVSKSKVSTWANIEEANQEAFNLPLVSMMGGGFGFRNEIAEFAYSYEKQFGILPEIDKISEDILRNLADEYALSVDVNKNAQTELELAKNKLEVLEEQYTQQRQIAELIWEDRSKYTSEEKKRKYTRASLENIPTLKVNQAIPEVEQLTEEVKELTKAEVEAAQKAKEIGLAFGITNKNALKEIQNVLLEYNKSKNINTLQEDENGFLIPPSVEDEFDLFTNTSIGLNDVLDTISKHIKSSKNDIDSYVEAWKEVRKYVSSSKIAISDKVKSEFGDDFNRMRTTIGMNVLKTDRSGLNIIKFLTDMNSVLGTTFDFTKNDQDAFRELYEFLRNKPLQIDPYTLPESIREVVNQILDGTYTQISQRQNNSPKIKGAKYNKDIIEANQREARSAEELTHTIETQTEAIENNTKAKEKNNKQKSKGYDYLEHATYATEDVEAMLQKVIDNSGNIPRDKAKTSVTSSADGTITGGSITYVDDALKRTVTEVYSLKKLTDEMAEATGDVMESEQALVLLYKKATDDGIARAKQEEKARKKTKKDLDEIHAKQLKYQGEIDRAKREALEHATRPIRTQDRIKKANTEHENLTDKINTYLGDDVISVSKSALQEIETAIADYKALVNRLQSKDNVPTMATTDFENKKAQSIAKIEGLITELQQAGNYTSDLRKEAEDLWVKLNEVGSGDELLPLAKAIGTIAEKFRALRKEHNAEIQKQKEIQDQYNENINVIKQLETETDKLNNMMASDIGKDRMSNQIEDQMNKTVEAAKNAKKAIQDVDQMFAQGKINAGQHTDAGSKYREAQQGSTTSQAKYEDAKAAQTLRDEKEAADALKKSLDNLVSAYTTLASDSKGKRTITFEEDVKQVQKAREEFANTRSEAEQLGLSLDKITKLEQNAFSDLQTKIAKSGATTIDGYIDSLNKLEEKMKKSGDIGQQSFNNLQGLKDAFALIQSNKDLSSFEGIQEYLKTINQLGAELPQKMKEIETLGKIEGIQSQVNFFDQLNVKSQTYKSTLSELKKKLDEFNKAMASGDKELINKAQIDLLKEAVPLINKLGKEAQGKGNLVPESVGQVTDVIQLERAMNSYAQSLGFTKQVGQVTRNENDQLTMSFANGQNEILKVTGSIDSLNQALRQTSVISKNTGGFITNLKASFKQMVGYFTRYYTGYTMMTRAIGGFRKGIEIVKEFDAAMTELHKVSNDTEEALNRFGKEAFNIAETIGSTGKEIINSAADWEKLGYAIEDASELAKNSALYSNVGDMDIDTATEHMVSTLKAYKEFDAQSSSLIVDKFNEIGNNYAITSEGIGSALERAAATLVAANNDLDQSIALITAGNIITQDPESVGNAIKVVSMRLRGAKEELESTGEETDGLVESTSKLQKKIMALTGVDIMLDDSTFKSTYDILLEISKVWNDLSDISRANVLEVIAGKQFCLKYMETYFYRTHLIARIA